MNESYLRFLFNIFQDFGKDTIPYRAKRLDRYLLKELDQNISVLTLPSLIYSNGGN